MLQYNISITLDSKIPTSVFLKAAISAVKGIAVMNDSFQIDIEVLSRQDYRPVL